MELLVGLNTRWGIKIWHEFTPLFLLAKTFNSREQLVSCWSTLYFRLPLPPSVAIDSRRVIIRRLRKAYSFFGRIEFGMVKCLGLAENLFDITCMIALVYSWLLGELVRLGSSGTRRYFVCKVVEQAHQVVGYKSRRARLIFFPFRSFISHCLVELCYFLNYEVLELSVLSYFLVHFL